MRQVDPHFIDGETEAEGSEDCATVLEDAGVRGGMRELYTILQLFCNWFSMISYNSKINSK